MAKFEYTIEQIYPDREKETYTIICPKYQDTAGLGMENKMSLKVETFFMVNYFKMFIGNEEFKKSRDKI